LYALFILIRNILWQYLIEVDIVFNIHNIIYLFICFIFVILFLKKHIMYMYI
jgi:hypothetical protein